MAEEKPKAEDEQLQNMVNQTIDLALMQKDAYLNEIETSNDILKIKDKQEFVFGLIMGQVLGLGIAALTQIKQGTPTPEDPIKIRDMVYKTVPQMRKRIFG